jgi:predicted SAM-dependent methyltransferase
MKKLLLFFFSHRTLALLRWDFYFLRVRIFNTIFFKQSQLQKLIASKNSPLFLNLGSGPRGIKSGNWLNVDGFIDKNVEFRFDFGRPMPFNDDLFDGIFCEHVIEHFDFEHGKALLTECHRILKPGGVIRIIVPHGNKILKSYFDSPEFIAKYKETTTGLPMEAINQWFYQRYEHQCIYDAPYMNYQLNKIGFEECNEVDFKTSKFNQSELLMDDEKYKWESLYFEGKKRLV